MHGFKILCEISKAPFKISHKILHPYTTNMRCKEELNIWRIMISWNYDTWSLSDTGPWSIEKPGLTFRFEPHVSYKEYDHPQSGKTDGSA